MTNFDEGMSIYIPVTVSEGPFPGESLITIDALEGPISGFIRSDQIKMIEDKRVVEATVQGWKSDCLTVRLHGSFFTTTGIANIAPGNHLRAS